MSEISTYLKVGTMRSCLAWSRTISSSAISRWTALWRLPRGLARPSAAGRQPAQDGRSITAVDLQREFLAMAHKYYRGP